MLRLLKVRLNQGFQAIRDPLSARPAGPFRGLPLITADRLEPEEDFVCPAGALNLDPLSIDLGKCLFCGDCAEISRRGEIVFTNDPRLGARRREDLIVDRQRSLPDIEPHPVISRLCRKSFKLRQVSAGGDNSAELELNALSNVNFDLGRYGVEFVASPRHADGILITGPLTRNMAYALRQTYDAVPEPRAVILAGPEAISGGLFASSPQLDRSFLDEVRADLYIPGWPPHPLTVLNALHDFLGRRR